MMPRTAKTARPMGGKCAPNGGKVRAKRGGNARLTGCVSLWKNGSLQPLQSLHPLGGRDRGNAHARGLAFAAARCARGDRALPCIPSARDFPNAERTENPEENPVEISAETSVKTGNKTGKTSEKIAETPVETPQETPQETPACHQLSLRIRPALSSSATGAAEPRTGPYRGGPARQIRAARITGRAYTQPPRLCGTRGGRLSRRTPPPPARLVSALCPESGQPFTPRAV